jgi:predicted DCC family thiol-disulfide oxidoreductase YuxK
MTMATVVSPAAVRPAIARFLAAPASPLPFGVLRIGLGLVLLVQALSVVSYLGDTYGTRGLVQSALVDRLVPSLTPRVGWFVALLAPIGVDEVVAIRLFFALHVGAVLAFTAGWRSRLAAVLTWATFVMLTTSGPLYTSGVDRFVRIALFYCMFAPVGAALSCDGVAGRTSGAPSAATRLWLRVLQVHLLVVYAASGIEKASGAQWWNGEALWRSMLRPDLGTLDFAWVASVPWLAKIGCWSTLLLECGYAVFVWPRRTSRWWVLAILAMHAGIAVVLGLWLFSFTMMLLSLSAWLVPCEPRTLKASRRSGFTVAYDGSCRVCRSVVGLAFELDRSGFLPIGRDHPRRVPALAGTGRLDRMVTVDRDGRMRSGADAFLAMWAHALSWPAIGKLARLAPVRAGYALFARHRHELGCRGARSRTAR